MCVCVWNRKDVDAYIYIYVHTWTLQKVLKGDGSLGVPLIKQSFSGWNSHNPLIQKSMDDSIPTLRIIGPSYKGVWICIAGFWDLQATSFEIPWFLGDDSTSQ